MISKNDESVLKNLKVLYVEDEDDIRKFAKVTLEDYVGKLTLASNGQEALEIMESEQFDLVIADILMPRVSGLELIREMRAKNTDAAVILATAHTQTSYLLEAIELRVDGYVVKPIDIKQLLRTMLRAVLPKFQARQISAQNILLNAISIFVGGKKIEIIKYLIENSDKEQIFYGSYEGIVQELGVSKPTVVKTFRQLIDTGLLVRVKNKIYKFQMDLSSYRG